MEITWGIDVLIKREGKKRIQIHSDKGAEKLLERRWEEKRVWKQTEGGNEKQSTAHEDRTKTGNNKTKTQTMTTVNKE